MAIFCVATWLTSDKIELLILLMSAAGDDDFVDDDFDWGAYKEKRVRELTINQQIREYAYGELSIVNEKEFLKLSTTLERVVTHFFHEDFHRCKILDAHLKKLATKYSGTKFLAVNAVQAPFLTTKLALHTLPCIIVFKSGAVVDRFEGFEFVHSSSPDSFPTSVLEKRLERSRILVKTLKKRPGNDENSEDESSDGDS
ncbi:gtpase inhibitor [Pelomyxa schiedti]|nr:gtpase inhibitor [Pelomyxa schiedti]